jgi:hypothetical protein
LSVTLTLLLRCNKAFFFIKMESYLVGKVSSIEKKQKGEQLEGPARSRVSKLAVQIFRLPREFLRMRADLHEMTVVLGALEDLMAQLVPVLLVLPLHGVLTHLPRIKSLYCKEIVSRDEHI